MIVSLSFIAFFAACAAKKPPQKRPPQATKPPATTVPAPPPEMPRTNARPSTSDVATPKRQASMRLIDRGRASMEASEFDRAASSFRDAINVDATNGVAYYYLASADLKLGQPEIAAGLLDKAEALLGADAEWMSRIDELRQQLGVAPSKPVVRSPIDQAF